MHLLVVGHLMLKPVFELTLNSVVAYRDFISQQLSILEDGKI